MKTASTLFKARIELAESSLCRLAKITRRDGVIHRMASVNADVVTVDGTYKGNPGFEITSYTFRRDGTSSAGEIRFPIDGDDEITREAIASGRFDGAEIQIFVTDFLSIGSGQITESSGYLGDLKFNDGGGAKFEIVGLLARLSQVAIETFGPNCNVNLGSARCRVPLLPNVVARSTAYVASAKPRGDFVRVFQSGSFNDRIHECTTSGTTAASAPTYTTTVGATTTDGTAVFTCREAWTRFATVASVINRSRFAITITDPRAVNSWFEHGALRFETGLNQLMSFDIRRWTQGTATVEMWHKAPQSVTVGDTLYIHPGCDKTFDKINGCTKFSNHWFYQGFPRMPGEDFKFTYGG